MRSIALAVILFLGTIQNGIGPKPAAYEADLTVIPCVQSPDSYPKAYYSSDRLGEKTALDVKFEKTESHYVATVQFDLPHVWIKVSEGACSFTIPVTLVSGHPRHVIFRPRPLKFMLSHGDHWLYGSVPDGIGYVELRTASREQRAIAAMDSGHFFFEYVAPGNYILNFSVSPGELVERPVTITAKRQGLEFDFRLSDLSP